MSNYKSVSKFLCEVVWKSQERDKSRKEKLKDRCLRPTESEELETRNKRVESFW